MKKLVLSAALVLVACSKTQDPSPDKPVEKAAGSAAATATAIASGVPTVNVTVAAPNAKPADFEVAWDAPAAWKSAENPSPMRKATYKIAKAAGDTEDAELAISSAGGGVEPNVTRWASQFGDAKPKSETRTVNGLKVTVVEIKGAYAGMGGASKDKQMLLGAIVDKGDLQYFFKMVGPEKTVTGAKPDFDKFVASFRAPK